MPKNIPYQKPKPVVLKSENPREILVYQKPGFFSRIFKNNHSKTDTKSWKSLVFKWLKKILLWFLIASIALVLLYKFVPVPYTLTMLDRKIGAIAKGSESEIHYTWIPYSDISKEAALSVIAAEDQMFPAHRGFDFNYMYKAFRGNLKGKRLKGASTLSQQTAKNVFLWQGRSYFRKIIEAYFTMLIELIWGKERILEVYLNVAETGQMTFGFEEASQKYFGHSARKMSRYEAAKIAAILPSPNKYSVMHPSSYVQRRVHFIARQMRALGGKSFLENL